MTTKTFKATSLALVAITSFAAIASTPASAKGRGGYGGHGPVRTNFGGDRFPRGGLFGPSQGTGSGVNKIIYRVPPWIPRFPFGGPPTGSPTKGKPTQGWGDGRGYGMGHGMGRGFGRGYGYGVGYSGGTACPVHFHWSPKFLRCIPNYV